MERSTHLARHMKSKTLFLMFLPILCSLMSPVSSGQARAQDQTFGHDLPAQPLTLEGAIAYGLAYNQTLQSAGKEIEAAKQNVKQAQAGFLPKLDTGYSFSSWTFDPIAKFESVRFQTNENPLNLWQAQITQPLFTGFALTGNYRNAQLGRDLAGYQHDEVRLNLVRNIQHAFLRTLLAEKILQVQRDTIKQLEVQRRNAEAHHKQGLTPRNDVLKADVALADARQKERAAAKQVTVLRAQLNQLLDLELDTPLVLSEWDRAPDPTPPLADWQLLYDRAEKQRPEYLAIQAAILQTEEGKRVAQSRWYPQAAIVGSYYRQGSDFLANRNDFTNEENAAIGVKVDWNWFEGGRTRAAVNEFQYRRQALEERKRDLLRQMHLQVKDACEQLQVSRTNLETARVAIQQARENERMTISQYREQVVVFSEVLDAQVYLTQAQVNYYEALFGTQLAQADLDRAVGGAQWDGP
jgi:outer membrane protein